MYRITNQDKYIIHAVSMVESHVAAAETAIAAGQRPIIANDSYLEVGFFIERVAVVYDHAYSRLSSSQRSRWLAYMEQAVWNVWNHQQARWGNVSYPWSGWSVTNPGNNYHFSFLKATMMLALANWDQSTVWFDFLQRQKFDPLVKYYATLPGGGSREGTGYGTAHMNLFENHRFWQASTRENFGTMTPHSRDTIDYWIHATVPTFNRFAPIGDQARDSEAWLFDYHERLVREAVIINAGTEQARRGLWWLARNSVNGMQQGFNAKYDLLTPTDTQQQAPTALAYHAPGVGHFFARSSWANDATWMSFVAGKYDESHAHQDQGSFNIYRREWQAVTQNIWSRSGINQATDIHNVVRFVNSNGATIIQNHSSDLASMMTYSNTNGNIHIDADLTNAYTRNRASVMSWRRSVDFANHMLRVSDVCTVGAGVTAVWQVQLPNEPIAQNDGSYRAGNLVIRPISPAQPNVAIVRMAGEYSRGYRLELRNPGACQFTVEMTAL